MANVEEIKTINENKIMVCLEMDKEELSWLKGNLSNMRLFSEDNLNDESRLLKRGRRESTKYFLLPKNLRDGVSPSNDVRCTRMNTEESHIFIFAVPRDYDE